MAPITRIREFPNDNVDFNTAKQYLLRLKDVINEWAEVVVLYPPEKRARFIENRKSKMLTALYQLWLEMKSLKFDEVENDIQL